MNPSDEVRCLGAYDTWLAGSWSSEGTKTNQAVGALFADTGALSAGFYDMNIFFYSTSATIMSFLLSHRNAANSADLFNQLVMVSLTLKFHQMDIKNYKIGANERIRVTLNIAEVALSQVSILWSRRA